MRGESIVNVDKELDPALLEETKQRLRARLERYALSSPYALNPKPHMVLFAIEGLARNEIKHGLPYCVCKVRTGTERDKQIICPCATISEEIEQWGQCDCGLFVRR